MFPLYFMSALIWLFALVITTLSILQFQWHNLWYVPIVLLLGAGPALLGRNFSSYRGTLELTPDHLLITQWAWLQSPQTFRFPWDQLASFRIGTLTAEQTEGMSGFIITTRDGTETRTLPYRSIGELERLELLLNSLIPQDADSSLHPTTSS